MSDARERDDEDAAAVLTVLAAIVARTAEISDSAATPRAVWGLPGARVAAPGPHAWWASGLPR